jgi:hypothetical protein
MTAFRLLRKRNKSMSKTLSGRILKGAAAAALAVAISLAAAAPGFAASHHSKYSKNNDPPARTYYDYSPAQSDYTAGQLGRRTNPVIVAPGAYGPPDPASCGGFHC